MYLVCGGGQINPQTLLFSEAHSGWRSVPRWVEFSIQLGYRWPVAVPGRRKIAMVSMPCDSAAAGLIALGALIKDLGRDTATNIGGHYDALLRYGRQYVESCRTCDVRCHPELKRCGYSSEATGLLRDKGKKLYRISGATDFENEKRLVVAIERGSWIVFPKRALDLQIDGEPPPRLIGSAGALPGSAYAQIVEGTQIISTNLCESYLDLCLAGRVAGETASREACAAIRFRCADSDHGLVDLLTIPGWSSSRTVSRMNFFNARTEQLYSHVSSTALVIADGDACFLKVLNQRDFQRSDIIGVVHRTVDRDHLELVGNRMMDLRQWYTEDIVTLAAAPSPPRGAGILILKRRAP
jgi:hypothetical protein